MKTLPRVFDLSWRLAILALPWQTRWFSDAWLAGWPWEQGRLSFYASWIPMIVFIALSLCHSCEGRNPAQSPAVRPENKIKFIWAAISLLIGISVLSILRDHASLRPILQWWAQVGLLTLFAFSLWRAKVLPRSVATWFAISLIPHALLGIWQFASQQVVGTKWLGIASQFPQTLGVSVVAHDGLRILRAYGGFPHPNIFGAWLVVGTLAAVWLAMTSVKRRDGIVWTGIASLFMSALVLTFARGAWIAMIVGSIILVGAPLAGALRLEWTRSGTRPAPTGDWFKYIGWIIPLLVFSLVLITQRQHVFARFDLTQRLEQKSVDERIGSLRTGIDLFAKHPVIGAGPNAELLALASMEKAMAPLEPPHNVFLLALDDVGIVGIIAIIVICFVIVGVGFKPVPTVLAIRHSPFVILLILALFDHYPWSTWSGQALVAMVTLLAVEPKTDP